jgi:cytochrome P450
MTFFLAMTIFPEVQRQAQKELDRVIGGTRLPVSKDRDNLPYIVAVMKETHRWHLVLPMGLPHTSTEEDTCRGYRIPKGAMLLANSWWFTHDPSVYPDPMAFRPERFLETPTHKPEPDPRNFIFGYGRRICPLCSRQCSLHHHCANSRSLQYRKVCRCERPDSRAGGKVRAWRY